MITAARRAAGAACSPGSYGRPTGTPPSIPSSRIGASNLPAVVNGGKGRSSALNGSKGVPTPPGLRAGGMSVPVPGRPIAAYGGATASESPDTSSVYSVGEMAKEISEQQDAYMSRAPPQLPSQRKALTLGAKAAPAEPRKRPLQAGLELNLPNKVEYTAEAMEHGFTFLPLNQDYPGLKRVHESPPVFIVQDFLNDEECAALIQTAGPLLQRSKTHAAAGSEATKGRTSLTCHLEKKVYPCPILLKKIHHLTRKPYGHMELPQVARYASSQRYVEHYDGVDPHTEAGRSFCHAGGQRVATVLVYLNDVSDGGCTYFKRLDLAIKPDKGTALVFFPGFMNGELDTDALHAGMPAIDTKWVSQVWLRQSFREDGQPSSPVPIEEQSLTGPLHEGLYRGLCIAGNDIHEAVMTFAEAKAWAAKHPHVQGFTFEHADREPTEPTRVWFKSRIEILYNESWWSYSTGNGM